MSSRFHRAAPPVPAPVPSLPPNNLIIAAPAVYRSSVEGRFVSRIYLIAYNTFAAATWLNLFFWIGFHAAMNEGDLTTMHFFTGKPVALLQLVSVLEIVNAFFGASN